MHIRAVQASSKQSLSTNSNPSRHNPANSSSTLVQLHRTIGNKAVQQMITGIPVIQRIAWPSKKQQQSKIIDEIAENWSDLETSDVKAFYAWCTSQDQFTYIPKALSYEEWFTLKEKCSGAEFDKQGFTSDQSARNVKGIYDYFTRKKVVPYNSYDMGSYSEINDLLSSDITGVQTEGTFDLDRIKLLDKTLAFELIEADKARHAAIWEKENNSELEQEKSTLLNQKLRAAKDRIRDTLALLVTAHEVRVAEEKEAAKKKAAIDGAVTAAETAYAFASKSALTQLIWNATKGNAGSTGYLEVGGSYSAAELLTAHQEWRNFSNAYEHSAGKVDYLQNIHSPGHGVAQDKLGHSNYESRSCRYQVDFISEWGGSRTVMHVGLQGSEK
ncbi:hypothetical protein [Paenibacillus hexagrammi]|uniref:Uncharacterized protein n=1 Tax=Paenibacillus hexagrammi TaxID=2908839 RepID=A0ABY3SP10_9BACL|nr:hypothetical protein [Paenibacillus sp. YPD9-1]UJF34831.1 hypothetical protein L0M14_06655 [Paenibacillus sp. YPD9-1]